MKLLERGRFLEQLADLLVETRRGRGRLALVVGEAGAGKTVLVDAFCEDRAAGVQVLRGTCDPVVPARPFAPLADIADQADPSLRRALDSADRDEP
jgi:predicted ATPase